MADLAGRGPLGQKQPKPAKKPRKALPKRSRGHQSALTKNARGKPCTLRLPGCRHDPEYTIFAHIRRFGWGGIGMKPSDLLGMFACDVCHQKEEAHHPDCTDTDILRALGETLILQLQSGAISIAGDD